MQYTKIEHKDAPSSVQYRRPSLRDCLKVIPQLVVMIAIFAYAFVVSPTVGIAAQPIELSDAELDEVWGGDLDAVEVLYEGQVLTFVQGNQAHHFDVSIGSYAFQNAQGVITNVQAVNSAVNLNIVVNIYLNGGNLF